MQDWLSELGPLDGVFLQLMRASKLGRNGILATSGSRDLDREIVYNLQLRSPRSKNYRRHTSVRNNY